MPIIVGFINSIFEYFKYGFVRFLSLTISLGVIGRGESMVDRKLGIELLDILIFEWSSIVHYYCLGNSIPAYEIIQNEF